MAKPRLEKVRALFYVLQHIQEGASNFDTPSARRSRATVRGAFLHLLRTLARLTGSEKNRRPKIRRSVAIPLGRFGFFS